METTKADKAEKFSDTIFKTQKSLLIKSDGVTRLIYRIREVNVMIDADLAQLYGVETKSLTKAMRRNIERFPEDFMFQLTIEEYEALRCQIGTSKNGRGGRRYLPYVFTQEGVAMLSGILRSPQAIQVNIEIMRAFVNLKKLINSNSELSWKIAQLEKQYNEHDERLNVVFEAIQQILESPEEEKRPIGFAPWSNGSE